MRNFFMLYIIAIGVLGSLYKGYAWSPEGIIEDDGFVSLFDGQNLDGWVNVNGAPETYTVVDDMIVTSGIPKGMLRTEKQYQNYILELEWRHMKEKGNAGLFIHSDDLPPVGRPFTRAIEIQIMDGNGGDVFAIQGATMTPWKLHPWGRSLPIENRNHPAGQWNRYRVESREGTIKLSVNGKEVNWGYHANPRKGYICLEAEGSEAQFRNIRIKELPGETPSPAVVAKKERGFRQLYNGNDLREWKLAPGSEGHWSPEGWILNYDGQSEAERREDKDLWTKEDFHNFCLIVDWRQTMKPAVEEVPIVLPDGNYKLKANGEQLTVPVNDAGDGGIYIRGNSKCQFNIWNWPVGSGEIYGYRTDENMPPSIRKGATPILNADNQPGEWNRFEITVIDDWVTCVLNGKTVINEAKLPGMPETGPIGLQHHGDSIQFANIYIKELP